MSQPQTVKRRGRLPLRQRPAALIAVGAARVLAHLPPRRIRAVLTLLRRRAAPATYQWITTAGADGRVLAPDPKGSGFERGPARRWPLRHERDGAKLGDPGTIDQLPVYLRARADQRRVDASTRASDRPIAQPQPQG